ncbi:hypothetical protein RIF29_25181 [Crotalaria pallida]|uniref:CCHC-type domain-containing protein n=1 Tax=Crotalaria pallida TaxID=3830 RepID=A0AAN9ELN2_CROPI
MGRELNLEYEGLYLICFQCGRYGHQIDECSEVVAQPANGGPRTSPMISSKDPHPVIEAENIPLNPSPNQEFPPNNDNELITLSKDFVAEIKTNYENNHFGPWMLVKRNQKFRGKLTEGKAKVLKEKQKLLHVLRKVRVLGRLVLMVPDSIPFQMMRPVLEKLKQKVEYLPLLSTLKAKPRGIFYKT